MPRAIHASGMAFDCSAASFAGSARCSAPLLSAPGCWRAPPARPRARLYLRFAAVLLAALAACTRLAGAGAMSPALFLLPLGVQPR